MIYTVTFNPSLDYVVYVDQFQEGKVNRTYQETMFAGGKGINVSIVLKQFNVENVALGFIAGFTGEKIQQSLNELNIHTNFIECKNGNSRINVKLKSEKETEINGMGPCITKEELDAFYRQLDLLQKDDYLILSGSIPQSLDQSMYQSIMRHIQGKGIKVVVDCTKDLLRNTLQYHPFLIKPNKNELEDLFNVQLVTDEDVVKYARKLQTLGAKNVLVSLDAEGAILISDMDCVYKQNAPCGKVINSVGAGDSLVAGFIAGYIQTNDYKESLKMAVYTGSASCFKEDLATYEDVKQLLSRNVAEH